MVRPADGPDWAVAPKDWGARVDYDKWRDTYTPDKAIALHHGGSGDYPAARKPWSVEREMAQLRAWEAWHIDGRGWRGLAYGWGIGQSGTVYRIRGWHTYGAHTGDWDGDGVNNNVDTIPFIWIASGNHHDVSPEAHDAIVRLRRYVEAESKRSLLFMGHQEVSSGTACPGPRGMNYVRANRTLPEEDELTPEEKAALAEIVNLRRQTSPTAALAPTWEQAVADGLVTENSRPGAIVTDERAMAFLERWENRRMKKLVAAAIGGGAVGGATVAQVIEEIVRRLSG